MKELSVAERACLEAGKVALKFLDSGFEVRHKGKFDLVTDADIECEKRIKKIISSEFPTHAFLGEEEGKEGNSSSVWVIDPIDGTTNYAHGVEFFAHSVALVKDGQLVCGSVYDPVRKKLYSAYSGKGATLNNRKISVSKISDLKDALIVTGFPYNEPELERKTLNAIHALRGNCQDLRRFGSASLDFCFVAQGVCDVFFEYSLRPWDVAAAMLVVREAGGKVSDINGAEAAIDSGHFLASNKLLHEKARQFLEGVQ